MSRRNDLTEEEEEAIQYINKLEGTKGWLS